MTTPKKAESTEDETPSVFAEPSPDALKVAKDDSEWRAAHPNEWRGREADESVGGESFTYLDNVSQQ